MEIPVSEDDSEAYLELVTRVVQGMVSDSAPRDIWLIRVDNWFGRKWCAFAGKVRGAIGVASTDRLVVPPFVAGRIDSVQYLHAAAGGYRSADSPLKLHRASRIHLPPTGKGDAGFIGAWARVKPVLDAEVHRHSE